MGAYSNYYQKGDWQDTLLFDATPGATVCFFTDAFTGKIMIHCHYLVHQDTGMMAVAHIGGVEGGSYSGVKALDSTCYADINGRGFVNLDGEAVAASEQPTLLPISPPQLQSSTQYPSAQHKSPGTLADGNSFSFLRYSYSYSFSLSFSSSFQAQYNMVGDYTAQIPQ